MSVLGKSSTDCKIDENNNGIHVDYYHTGNILREFYHNNGIKEGVCRTYSSDGKLSNECYYINDKLHGPYKDYNIDGKLRIECTYTNGVVNGTHTTIESCKKTIYNFVNGVKHGEYSIEIINTHDNNYTKGMYCNNIIINYERRLTSDNTLFDKYCKVNDTLYKYRS